MSNQTKCYLSKTKERTRDFLMEIYLITRLGLLTFFALGLLLFWLGYYVGTKGL